jgi:hypothetical protein
MGMDEIGREAWYEFSRYGIQERFEQHARPEGGGLTTYEPNGEKGEQR